MNVEEGKSGYQVCVYDMMAKEKIYQEKFLMVREEVKSENVDIFVFMHPYKVIGIIIYDQIKN